MVFATYFQIVHPRVVDAHMWVCLDTHIQAQDRRQTIAAKSYQ
jgi:hypothetical protein